MEWNHHGNQIKQKQYVLSPELQAGKCISRHGTCNQFSHQYPNGHQKGIGKHGKKIKPLQYIHIIEPFYE